MKTKIGGQAVLEGVMMRGETSMALAVRDENGVVRMDTTRLPLKKPWYRKVPFLRGVVNLVVSMVSGMKIIGKSAEVFAEEEIDTSGKSMGAMMGFSVVIGLLLAALLFIFVPTKLTALILKWTGAEELRWLRSVIEGAFKLAILIGYMSSITLMKEIRRVFMYHGAEHKTIACFENELPLTVENVQKCSRYHDRCGTSFIVFVVILSIVLMIAVEAICYAVGFEQIAVTWVRVLIKIAMLPLTAAFSYEMLMLLARSNFFLFRPLKWLGKQFQKLTTREPDDDMCQVAIAAFTRVLEMDADTSMPEEHFPKPVPLGEIKEKLRLACNEDVMESCDLDWILCNVLRIKREEIKDDVMVPFGWQMRIEKMIERANSGEPLQYVLGDVEFFDKTFVVCPDVLIPRPETELVCEEAMKHVKKGDAVLDMCCGSGVIGLTIADKQKCRVTLADVSQKALDVAKQNAKLNKIKAKFVCGDMFEKIGGKFRLIVCNPPYIATSVIETLDDKVKNYEPRIALDGGADGLDFYRNLAQNASKHLEKGGTLVMEIGFDQAQAVQALFGGEFDVEIKKDYGNCDRIAICKTKD